MPGTTTRLSLPYPVPDDTVDVPRDIKALADVLSPSATVFAQGTLAARPAAGVPGRLYYASDQVALYYDTGTAWTSHSESPVMIGPGGALPSGVNGQSVVYQLDASGALWHLIYQAGYGNNRWTLLGGSPIAVGDPNAVGASSSGYWAASGLQLTIPITGYYDVEFGCYVSGAPTVAWVWIAGVGINGADPIAGDHVYSGMQVASGTTWTTLAGRIPIARLFNAGTVLRLMVRNDGFAGNFASRYMRAMPLRIGG